MIKTQMNFRLKEVVKQASRMILPLIIFLLGINYSIAQFKNIEVESFDKVVVSPDIEAIFKESDQLLFDEIMNMDKEFFYAYNNCDLEKQASIYGDDIEFFHDKGGLMTSKEAIIEATKNNICGKVTRELIKRSVEVYPIANYGAVQIGFHKFYNNQEPEAISTPSKFIVIWHKSNENWKIKKVISLH